MRIKLFAVVAIAGVFCVASCDWFSSANADQSSFSIEGRWKIDSVDAGKDSSAAVGLLALALASKDSIPPGIQFNTDSTFIELPSAGSLKRKYYLADHNLFLEQDSGFVPYTFTKLSDSIVQLYSKDSLFIQLKRQ